MSSFLNGLKFIDPENNSSASLDEQGNSQADPPEQPVLQLSHWDMIALRDNARTLRQIADDIDAIFNKAAS